MVADAGYKSVDINDTSHKPEMFLKREDEQANFVKTVIKKLFEWRFV